MQTLLLSGEWASGTFLAFIPAIVAIVLALITKQVYLSLFAGIFVGAMFLADGNPIDSLYLLFNVMVEELNLPILAFLVILGIVVILLQKSGGSKAYGEWASDRIKTKSGALAATAGLGCLIFVDDYFNCLTVGSVMRPVTDKFGVSRSKLAYIIDATAAPVCIIAPISSWASAVGSYIPVNNEILFFIEAIPFNLYALMTIAFVFFISLSGFDFGKMRSNEMAAAAGDLLAGETDLPSEDVVGIEINPNGKVRHLIIPIVVLIASCVGAMIYVGYVYSGAETLLQAFSWTDSSMALAIGSAVALIVTMVYYIVAKVVNFKECMASITEGFKSMVPAILILVFAWTIGGIMGARGGYLDAQAFINKMLEGDFPLWILPFAFFVIACIISFSTGTSWGTFAILLPLGTAFYMDGATTPEIVPVFLLVAAILSGGVFGDHISPISDTTIMASSGAQCNHIDHVKTQLPYAGIIAAIAGLSYLVLGLILQNVESYVLGMLITLAMGFGLLVATIVVIKILQNKKAQTPAVLPEVDGDPV